MSSSGNILAAGCAANPGDRPSSKFRAVRVDDTLLVREAQNGNTAAFEELVRHYDRAVLGLALHLTGSREDAQDIYQDAFLRAYRNLPRFRFECSFYTWLYRIVTNLCLDHLRRNRMRKLDVSVKASTDGADEELVAQMPDLRAGTCPERSSRGREVREKISRALLRLSARERMVFELKHYQGLKLRTVAVMLNTTENTIKNTLFRATQKLRVELAELR
jgi:RNA polymerase sigma-70 factor (ECF subfamily)